MHREILGAPKDKRVDHWNGDGLDNRRRNLRLCTVGQNCANARSRDGSSSSYKGVHWAKRQKKWKAAIVVNYERFHLGYFDGEEDAGRAYDSAALERQGEFARLNFPVSQ